MSVAIPRLPASAGRAPLVSWTLTWATAHRVLGCVPDAGPQRRMAGRQAQQGHLAA